ncbi:M28 family peptidase [Phormidium sp. FACHB-592]|uniref:M28 family peptidase n=1 Tax=Stenomitos frigidus AS-A4 TaxID=2933935 RepID=A0ABV0KKG1_9CYAN|nr:M28 family peptidase [Phormidium sp. FACHB-592]MBD2077008.1 M28 family peptidase [Phormidium sp. FACHB-592]
MQRSILGVLLAIALFVITSCNLASSPPLPKRSPNSPTSTSSTPPQASLASQPPQVNSTRLFEHIEALSFERFESSDRDRARRYLVQTLTGFGWKPQLQVFEGGVNVFAQRPGTTADADALLVSAHYDTVQGSPGADDNSSAIATTLEVARLLGSRSTQRPLWLAFFDREETGLLGSLNFTSRPENLVNLAGVVNLEMMGYACYTPGCQKYPEGLPVKLLSDRGDFLGVIGDQEHLPLLNAFQMSASTSPTLPAIITVPIPLKGLLTPDVLRSDHAPFWARNIGAVMVGDTANFRNPHYHQPSDTPETLDRAFLAGATQRVVNAVTTLLDSRDALTTTAN